MPYVDEETREELRYRPSESAGELAYELFRQVMSYVEWNGLRYATIADVLAATETAKQEFYRRQAATYEDSKIAVNGDVVGWPS